VILSILIVLCHREMGAAVLLTYLWLKRGPRRAIVLGLVLGEFCLLIYTRGLMSAAPELRIAYFLDHASNLWRIFSPIDSARAAKNATTAAGVSLFRVNT
jgi:hypothetical protein